MERGGRDRRSEDPATPEAAEGYAAAITVVCAKVWRAETRRFRTYKAPFEADARVSLAEAALDKAPIWVILTFSGGWPNWYEPSAESGVESDFDRPRVDWSAADDDLSAVAPTKDPLFSEVRQLLPFVYDLGATRAFAEISHEKKKERARLFPACGFISVRPEADRSSLGSLEPLRLGIAVIDTLILTLPHPQVDAMRSLDRTLEAGPEPPPDRGLNVPVRYLPTQDIDSHHIADGIALHLGVTCERTVQLAERELVNAEEGFSARLSAMGQETSDPQEGDGLGSTRELREASRELSRLGGILRRVERELAAMMLRTPPSGSQHATRLEPTEEVAARYQAALEKVGSLTTQVRLVGETMASTLLAEQLAVVENERKEAEKERKKADDQRAEGDRLQRAGTILASFVLGPGLVAAVYGANVSLPAKDTPVALTAMVLFMLGVGLVSGWLLHAVPKQSWRLLAPSHRTRDHARLHAVLASGATALVFAIAAVVVGLERSTLRLTGRKHPPTWVGDDWITLALAIGIILAVGIIAWCYLYRPWRPHPEAPGDIAGATPPSAAAPARSRPG